MGGRNARASPPCPRSCRECAFAAPAEAAQIIFAFTPNSAAAERVFSMLKAMFGDQQMDALADIIQTALMLRINKRKVG